MPDNLMAMDLDLARELAVENGTKIVLFVMDGLGGLPHPETGRTELESAYTPHLDMIAREAACGLTVPVGTGITPGSGPGHLALFGYDPYTYNIGRGVLEAVGIDFDLQAADVAARGNFCTVDSEGRITDRRAGRIGTERCAELTSALSGISLDGVQLFVEPVREHRFVLVLRPERVSAPGKGLSDQVADTDPQALGEKPLAPRATSAEGAETSKLVARFVAEAGRLLADKSPANMLLLRGFSKRPQWPAMADVFKVRPAAVAHYPMYRGLAKLVGMDALAVGPELGDSMTTLRENWGRYDFFFVHYKHADTAGEDGDFDRKVAKLEEVDASINELLDLKPDVLMIAGDHSTPAIMGAHSWHPVPFMLKSRLARADECGMFGETELTKGSLGTFPAVDALPLALAHAGRLRKFGA
jgi:2,3-bisphosphoglycerate-independent phosphoglycerate mutase